MNYKNKMMYTQVPESVPVRISIPATVYDDVDEVIIEMRNLLKRFVEEEGENEKDDC